jgi:hypothetical protein
MGGREVSLGPKLSQVPVGGLIRLGAMMPPGRAGCRCGPAPRHSEIAGALTWTSSPLGAAERGGGTWGRRGWFGGVGRRGVGFAVVPFVALEVGSPRQHRRSPVGPYMSGPTPAIAPSTGWAVEGAVRRSGGRSGASGSGDFGQALVDRWGLPFAGRQRRLSAQRQEGETRHAAPSSRHIGAALGRKGLAGGARILYQGVEAVRGELLVDCELLGGRAQPGALAGRVPYRGIEKGDRANGPYWLRSLMARLADVSTPLGENTKVPTARSSGSGVEVP